MLRSNASPIRARAKTCPSAVPREAAKSLHDTPPVRHDRSVAEHHGTFDFGRVEERGGENQWGRGPSIDPSCLPSLFPAFPVVQRSWCMVSRIAGPNFAQLRRRVTGYDARGSAGVECHCPISCTPAITGQQSENMMSPVSAAGSERGSVAAAPWTESRHCRRSTVRFSRRACAPLAANARGGALCDAR
jgi:hypothetical protein